MDYEQKIIKVVKDTLPAVVSIVIGKDMEEILRSFHQGPLAQNPFLWQMEQEAKQRLEEMPRTEDGQIRIGGGSGFIASSDGLILTNKHVVIDPQANYTIIFSDGRNFPAKVLARDPLNDVAILKMDGNHLPTLKLGVSSQVELGQGVVAIGNALGEFTNTISTGIVSGLARFISALTDLMGHEERLRGLIQTDAAINPGNSGGPLLNLSGEVIGINSAIVFGAQNIGFAIPIDKAKKDLEEIQKFGRLRKPFLGIRYLIINDRIKERLKLPVSYGALIMKENLPGYEAILPDSPAAKAGLKEFDIILACNGKKMEENQTLEDFLEQSEINQKITFKILREGKEKSVDVTLEERKI